MTDETNRILREWVEKGWHVEITLHSGVAQVRVFMKATGGTITGFRAKGVDPIDSIRVAVKLCQDHIGGTPTYMSDVD